MCDYFVVLVFVEHPQILPVLNEGSIEVISFVRCNRILRIFVELCLPSIFEGIATFTFLLIQDDLHWFRGASHLHFSD